MSRYKAQGTWEEVRSAVAEDAHGVEHVVTLQQADCLDTRGGHVYSDGAYRVTVDGKPRVGKGGTVPFYGESAWSQGANFFDGTLRHMHQSHA